MKLWLNWPMINFLKSMIITLPTSLSLSYWWNLGSLLFMLMMIQILSGLCLTLFYSNNLSEAFESIWILHLESFNGSLIHWIHSNNSSFLFFILYLHLVKAIYVESFKTNKWVYASGFIILVLIMLASFLGYVLPFGQMSLWGATVITNLLSVVHLKLVIFIWAGYSVNELSLKFFYTFHFLIPFMIIMFLMVHLWLLHYNGSTHWSSKNQFYPLYWYKDSLNLILLSMLIWWSLNLTYFTNDIENFLPANPMVSPLHIKPEWYFLLYYAILRSIPNKILGVLMFMMSLLVILLLLLNQNQQSNFFYPLWSLALSMLVTLSMLLILVGNSPVEWPFFQMGQILTFMYFVWFIFILKL